MISQPWQTKEQEENMINRDKQYLKFFDNLFSKDIKDCKVLPEGTYLTIYRKWFFDRIYHDQINLEKIIRYIYKKIKSI